MAALPKLAPLQEVVVTLRLRVPMVVVALRLRVAMVVVALRLVVVALRLRVPRLRLLPPADAEVHHRHPTSMLDNLRYKACEHIDECVLCFQPRVLRWLKTVDDRTL